VVCLVCLTVAGFFLVCVRLLFQLKMESCCCLTQTASGTGTTIMLDLHGIACCGLDILVAPISSGVLCRIYIHSAST
jgi:hypothetical protein